MHTGDRPYRCDQCDYSTTQSNTLNKHRLIHAKGAGLGAGQGEPASTLHKCDRCDFKTVMLQKLEEHLAAHDREQQVVLSHAAAAAVASSTLPLDVAPPIPVDLHAQSLPLGQSIANSMLGVPPQEQVLLAGAQISQASVDHLRLAAGMLAP